MTRSYPALARFLAIGLPMMPSPMNPIGAPSKSAITPLPSSLRRCPVPHFRQPSERLFGRVPRPVFQTHPTIVSGIIQRLQHKWIVNLAGPGLVSRGTVGDLHVADQVDVGGDRRRQISAHALGVIDVVLQQEIGMRNSLNDGKSRFRCGQKVTRSVERVEWLEDLENSHAGGGVSCKAQVLDQRRRLRLLEYVVQS